MSKTLVDAINCLVASGPEKAKLDPAVEIVYASPTEPSLANPNGGGGVCHGEPEEVRFGTLAAGERLSRRERRQIDRQFQADNPGWEIIQCSWIDVGNESHFVAIDPKRTQQPVRVFGSWTAALHEWWAGL